LLGHSPGADEELSRAMRLGLPVFTKLEDVPNLIRQVDPGLIVVPMQGVVAPAAATKARPSLGWSSPKMKSTASAVFLSSRMR
jgi:hypothetical protein